MPDYIRKTRSRQSSEMAEKWEHHIISFGDDGGCSQRDHPNSSDMFSSKFPNGLRVLAFDEDPQFLHILENHLKEFQYEVFACREEERAMYLLRNHRRTFDIAIVEAQYSDGDRFRLISEIGSEMDLPIIIISKDDSVESVIKWMRNGACDYLIKPIRPEDLRLIFKHLVKKMEVRRSVAVAGEAEEKAPPEKSSSVGDSTIRKYPNKRKRSMCLDGQANAEDQDHGRDSTTKKRRVVWDDNLHNKFMEAVSYLGNEAVPKKILERMKMDGISRENVASHLQKYRLNLKKQTNEQRDKRKQTNDQRDERNQFSTHHINNILQPSPIQQQSKNSNHMTQLISPLGHHDDGVSVAISARNLVMNHHHHHPHPHQMSEFTLIDQNAEVFQNDNDDEPEIAQIFFTQNPEEMSLFHVPQPMIATTGANGSQLFANPQHMMHVHEPSVHIPVPSSLTHSSFLDQNENMVNIHGQQWLYREQQ